MLIAERVFVMHVVWRLSTLSAVKQTSAAELFVYAQLTNSLMLELTLSAVEQASATEFLLMLIAERAFFSQSC